MTPNYVADIFSGVQMPTSDDINSLCQLFEVDYKTGESEFRKLYDSNAEDHNIPETKEDTSDIINTMVSFDRDALLKSIYGKIPYSDYIKLTTIENLEDALPILYGIVDFKTYMELHR